jgi:hypothetical protein
LIRAEHVLNRNLEWFRWFTLSGFVITNLWALPGIFHPEVALEFVGAQPTIAPVWPAFGFLLMFLVSWFALAAAYDPLGYLPTCWMTVWSHFASAGFWIVLYPCVTSHAIPWLGPFEIVFGLFQLVLLASAVKYSSQPVARD